MTPARLALRRGLSRRTFLRGAGVALALPWLDAMQPAFARADSGAQPPRRMLVILTNMGILASDFFPKTPGRDYETTPYLAHLKEFRDQMTVLSGVAHPEVDGGHPADAAFLTGAPHPGRSQFRNTISLDQLAAESVGNETRFPTLPLAVATETRSSLSYTRSGVVVPASIKPSAVFKRLFIEGNPEDIAAQVTRLQQGRSILDVVAERARSLQRDLGAGDRGKLDQYFTSVRELETRLQAAEAWEHRPKPKVDVPPVQDISDAADLIGRTDLMFRIARLALATDSSRLITLMIAEDHNPTVKLEGITQGHHTLTHHGNRPEAIAELRRIEAAQFQAFGRLLRDLVAAGEGGGSLLDHTMVLYGSSMGNASAHTNDNLPVLLAGGGFKHGQHLAFDRQRNYPLSNLFVSMLQRFGVPADSFATSTGTLRGLEPV